MVGLTRSPLAITGQQIHEDLDSLFSRGRTLQNQPHDVHANQSGRAGKVTIRVDPLVAHRHTVFVDSVLSTPQPSRARQNHRAGPRVRDLDVLGGEHSATWSAPMSSNRLRFAGHTIRVLGEQTTFARGENRSECVAHVFDTTTPWIRNGNSNPTRV